MKHVSIHVLEGGQVSSIDGPHEIFSEANEYLRARGESPLFIPEFIGVKPSLKLKQGYFTMAPDRIFTEVDKTDLVIIPPAFTGDLANTIEVNKAILPWIIRQQKEGAEIVSLCIGAFLLAATGLLNGQKCATNWMLVNEFRSMYPDVNLLPDSLLTDERGIYTSAGGLTYMNMILYLVEKYAGRGAAIHCTRVFQIDTDRTGQAAFLLFKGQKDHSDEIVRKVQEHIEGNYGNKISVDGLAGQFFISRRNLEMRFKKATGNTINEYIQRVKVEAAKKMLEVTGKSVNEIMYDSGYQDDKAFRTVFRKITGLSPIVYRKRFQL